MFKVFFINMYIQSCNKAPYIHYFSPLPNIHYF